MTTAPQNAAATPAGVVAPRRLSSVTERLASGPVALYAAGLLGAMAVSAVLNTVRLSQNGYANTFYSAGVKSMLRSLHNFVFVSFDPGGLVTVDKPPLALWAQALSAKLFGFHPLSLLLPEAIMGVLSVALLYVLLARRLGLVAAFAGALTLAVFPSFVAVSRENGVDPLLIFLMLAACGATLRAIDTASLRWLIGAGVLVGLAFNTKMLAAYLVVPGLAAGYLLCAAGSLRRRVAHTLVAGAAMLAVSFAWIAFVEATPASKRPYVGSSTNNTELGLAFEYNGVGRVGGQVGGPGRVPVRPGARVPVHRPHPRVGKAGAAQPAPSHKASGEPRETVIPFGGPPGALRLFEKGLGDQAGWMLPFAIFGLLATALLALPWRRQPRDAAEQSARDGAPPSPGGEAGSPRERPALSWRRDRRLAVVMVLGGWFLVEAVVLSVSKGIVHPYYVSALAPGTGAMAGAGVVAFAALAADRRRLVGLALAGAAVAITVAVQILLLHRAHYMGWFIPAMLIAAGVAVCALVATRRLALPSVSLALGVLLVAPGAYAATTWQFPVEGTFPAAGPQAAAGAGGVGVSGGHRDTFEDVIAYVRSHRPGSRWALFTDSAPVAAPFILMGLPTGALAGYSGTDPALDARGLARLVREGKARYVLIGGEFSSRGGNRATAGTIRACRELPDAAWQGPLHISYGLVLFDCAGRERALEGA